MFRETHVNMGLLHEYLLHYRYLLFKNTCYEMALDWHGTNINLFSLITEFGMLLLKLDISRHRTVGTHHVQYLTLKTPEQTKQRPASLDVDSFIADSVIHQNGFLKANQELALKEIRLYWSG